MPDSYRDFYMDSSTKKLINWAHHFESRKDKSGFKSVDSYRRREAKYDPLPL